MIILEDNFKWHLEAFASELFILYFDKTVRLKNSETKEQTMNWSLSVLKSKIVV